MFTSLRGLLTGVVVAGLAAGVWPAATATAGPSQMAVPKQKVFLPSSRPQSFKVPAGVTIMTFDLVGSGGGGGAGQWVSPHTAGQGGGAGAVVRCRLTVQPGGTVQVSVGSGGHAGGSPSGDPALAGGGEGSETGVQIFTNRNSLDSLAGANWGTGGHSGFEGGSPVDGKGGTTGSCSQGDKEVAPASFAAGGNGQEAKDVPGGYGVIGGAGGKTGTLPKGCPKGSGAGGKGGNGANARLSAHGKRGGNGCAVLSW